MTEKELILFINRIRRMCNKDSDRMSCALVTLQEIMKRQKASPVMIDTVIKLRMNFEVSELATYPRDISDQADLDRIFERARARRQALDDAHRGCS